MQSYTMQLYLTIILKYLFYVKYVVCSIFILSRLIIFYISCNNIYFFKMFLCQHWNLSFPYFIDLIQIFPVTDVILFPLQVFINTICNLILVLIGCHFLIFFLFSINKFVYFYNFISKIYFYTISVIISSQSNSVLIRKSDNIFFFCHTSSLFLT